MRIISRRLPVEVVCPKKMAASRRRRPLGVVKRRLENAGWLGVLGIEFGDLDSFGEADL
jgi:hypothetical protein